MQNQPKVSVVIPMYNTEKYISETIESLLTQTLQDLEVIVVNDGSTDNSLAIVQQIAERDARVRVFSQANQGVSAARNTGVSHVQGEFVYYLDSDDYLVPEALQTCYDRCVKDNLDFVFFNAESFNEDQKDHLIQSYDRSTNIENSVYKGADMLRFLLEHNSLKTPVWLNFIRFAYIKRLGQTFYPGIIHEDELYTFKLYLNADRVGYIPRVFSKRRIRKDSIMTQKFSWKNLNGYFTVAVELMKYRHEQPEEYKAIIDHFLTQMLNAVIWIAHVMPMGDKFKIYSRAAKLGFSKYISMRSWMVLFFKQKK